MKKKLIKPDFYNNIVNISATFEQFLTGKTDKPTIEVLKQELNKQYRNIVFIIFDGMGINPININLNNKSFIKKNIKKVVTSTFPSTTTNATTSYLTAKYPIEHGWLGWSIYFEELNRAINIYLSNDTYTEEEIDPNFVKNKLPIIPFYKENKSDYVVSKVVPSFWHDGEDNNRYVFTYLDEMFESIDILIKDDNKQFIYTYCPEPDYTMHDVGVTSKITNELISEINNKLESFVKEHEDTLFVVSADHGQVDIDGYIEFYKDTELNEMLLWPPYLEPRATSFKVKEEYKEVFKNKFIEKYGEDFDLFEMSELISEGYFGLVKGKYEYLLGDYMAVATGHKMMLFAPDSNPFKGHHTSLTEEMEVPLIIVKGGKYE